LTPDSIHQHSHNVGHHRQSVSFSASIDNQQQNIIFFFDIMRAFLLSSIFVAAAAAFAPCASTPRLSSRSGQQLNPLAMSTVGEDLPLVITGDNIQLTDAIVEHANKRVGGQVKKLAKSGAIRQCTLHLSVSKNPKVRL